MQIDPTDNMVNGYVGGMSWSRGVSYEVGELVVRGGIDVFGNSDHQFSEEHIKKINDRFNASVKTRMRLAVMGKRIDKRYLLLFWIQPRNKVLFDKVHLHNSNTLNCLKIR